MGLCVHPNVEYSIVRILTNDDNSEGSYLIIVATELLDQIDNLMAETTSIERLGNGDYNILFKVNGDDFNNGAACYHPMNKSRISPFLLGQHVTTDAGTGIVHTAPTFGADDAVAAKNASQDAAPWAQNGQGCASPHGARR